MYGQNPDKVYEALFKQGKDLDCCTFSDRVHEDLFKFSPLKTFGVSDAKDLLRLKRDLGNLELAIDFVLTSVGMVDSKPEPGQISFLEGSCCICINTNLYAYKLRDGVHIFKSDSKVRSWQWVN